MRRGCVAVKFFCRKILVVVDDEIRLLFTVEIKRKLRGGGSLILEDAKIEGFF